MVNGNINDYCLALLFNFEQKKSFHRQKKSFRCHFCFLDVGMVSYFVCPATRIKKIEWNYRPTLYGFHLIGLERYRLLYGVVITIINPKLTTRVRASNALTSIEVAI